MSTFRCHHMTGVNFNITKIKLKIIYFSMALNSGISVKCCFSMMAYKCQKFHFQLVTHSSYQLFNSREHNMSYFVINPPEMLINKQILTFQVDIVTKYDIYAQKSTIAEVDIINMQFKVTTVDT